MKSLTKITGLHIAVFEMQAERGRQVQNVESSLASLSVTNEDHAFKENQRDRLVRSRVMHSFLSFLPLPMPPFLRLLSPHAFPLLFRPMSARIQHAICRLQNKEKAEFASSQDPSVRSKERDTLYKTRREVQVSCSTSWKYGF